MPVVKSSLDLLGSIDALGELGGPLDGVAAYTVFLRHNLSGTRIGPILGTNLF